MVNKNYYQSESNRYNITLPEGWIFEEDKNLASIFEPNNGKGVLQISSYETPIDYDINVKKELAEFVQSYFEGLNFIEIIAGIQDQSQYSFFELENENTHWAFWILYEAKSLLFITYNCEMLDKGKEVIEIYDTLSSIQIFHKA